MAYTYIDSVPKHSVQADVQNCSWPCLPRHTVYQSSLYILKLILVDLLNMPGRFALYALVAIFRVHIFK